MPKPGRSRARSSRKAPSAFMNVKNQLAPCGLWCGSCLVGNGTVNDLALGCRKAITDYGVDDWGPEDIDFDGLLKGLVSVGSMKACVGCLKGGGRTDCEIRSCAFSKGLAECVECHSKKECKNKKILHIMRTGARRVGMKVKDKSGDRSKILRDWIAEMERVDPQIGLKL